MARVVKPKEEQEADPVLEQQEEQKNPMDEMKTLLAQIQKEREALEALKSGTHPEDNISESEKRASDAQFDKEAKDWGEVYAKMPKVRIKIPFDPLNKHDATVPVCVNGYNYFIQRGVTVDVPQIVADILENAGYI